MAWWEAVLRIFLAVVIGSLIGIDREKKNRPAGTRTHVLVCLGAAVIAVLEAYLVSSTIALNQGQHGTGVGMSLGRISAQVVSGIGFLGAGTIFISQKRIAGLTTAASLWNVGCLGLASGLGYYGLAIGGCAAVLITLTLLQRIVTVNSVKNVEVKFIHRVDTLNFLNKYFEEIGVKVLDLDFHVETKGGENVYTNLYTLDLAGKTSYTEIVNRLSEYKNIQSIRTRNT